MFSAKEVTHVPTTCATQDLAHARHMLTQPTCVNCERAAHPARCAALVCFLPAGRERFPIPMIPEESFNFNRFSPSGNFDHPEVRWPHLLQQDAVSAMEAGRHLLAVCPICQHPWYKAGRQEFPRLTPEQLVFLGALLQVDTQALYLLPRAICTMCSALHLGGMFSAETYPHHIGYRFLWECATPRRFQLLAMVCTVEELTLDALVQMIPVRFAEPVGDEMRSVLAWLETCSFPETIQTLSDEQSQYLARSFPPGNTIDGSLCQWRGYACETSCSLLGGRALVSLAVTTRHDALPPFESLRLGWQVLARAMRVVL